MGDGLLTRVTASVLVVGGAGLAVSAPTAAATDPTPALTVVAASYSDYFGDLHWHAGQVYAIADSQEIRAYPADGSSPGQPSSTTPIPATWHSDGWWQSDRDAFVVGPDGSLYVRSPNNDHMGGGGFSPTHGWGIGKLSADGTVAPVTPPPGASLGGVSDSLALDPEGDGVFLGGTRYRQDGQTYGVVARLPLPVPDDQQAASEIVVSADGYDPQDGSSYHPSPFRAADHLHAATEPFISSPRQLDVKSHALYFENGLHAIERVDLRTGEIVTVAGGPYVGWDSPLPTEGASAMTPYITVQAGPVVDRAGNIFFVQGGASRYDNSEGVVWEVRASDGTLHQVAGGGFDDVADPGDDPLSLRLRTFELALDPDGNLYAVNNTNGGVSPKQVVRFNGVAAADTVPGAPTALTATAGPGRLAVSWGEPTDDGGQSVTDYTVTLHPVTGPDVVRTVTGTTTTFSGLANGASYDVAVAATNGRGTGPAAVTSASPADYQAVLAPVGPVAAQEDVLLDATGSRAPADATYRFSCGDDDSPLSAPSTTPTFTCSYLRGNTSPGWAARVVMTDPATGTTYGATRAVAVSNTPGTVEGSAGFPTANLVLDVPTAPDGSLTSPSCGPDTTGATCQTVDGARVVLTAAPGTFPTYAPGAPPAQVPHVRIYRADDQTLQGELGSDVQVQNGIAVTWTPEAPLPKPLMLSMSPAAGPRGAGQGTGPSFDLGGLVTGMAQQIGNAANAVVATVGSVVNAAANAVSSGLAGLWAGATQNLAKPNNSAVNDVAVCSGELKVTPSGYGCEGYLAVFRGVPTDRISAMDARSGVVASGGANVVASGGGNVVASGGANLSAHIEPGQVFHLDAASVVAAGGLNVVAPGGANLISDNGLGIIGTGGANVVAAGGLNLTAILVRDPGFAVVAPTQAEPPTAAVTLDPPAPAGGVYPFGTQVSLHVTAAAAGAKSVQSVHVDLSGAVQVPHTLVAGSSATAVVARPGTTTVAYGATDDQLATSAPASVAVTIAAPAKPAPPTSVGLVGGLDRQSATVSWTAPVDHGDLPLTGFGVTLTDQGTGEVRPTVPVAADTASAVVTGLTTGHTYRATVSARSDAGESVPSAPSAPVLLAVAPQAPSGLTATAGDGQVVLTWSAPADDGGSAVTGYVVQRGASAQGPFTTIASPAGAAHTDTTVANGSTYFYVVKAVTAAGTSGASTATSASPLHVRTAQTVSFSQPADRTYGAPDAPLAVSASSGLPVVLTSLSTGVCTVAGGAVHVVAAGSCRVEAGQPGDADRLAAAPVTRTFTVARASLRVTATNAVAVVKGKRPAVAATYAGFVNGDGVFDLTPAARCAADPKAGVTRCSGVGSPNYAPTYIAGKVVRSRTGYAFVSPPVVYGRLGSALASKVALDGGRATLAVKGGLPPSVKAVTGRTRTSLVFKGVPTAAGSWRVTVSATVRGRVAKQVVVFVVE